MARAVCGARSMKVRRAIITERYNDVVDSLYDAEE